MRCVVGQEWGANKQSMITLYCALLRSVLDYGCIVYGSASISMLKKLDLIQARALRCITGAIKTTPISAMQVEIGESPLDIRRKKLSVAYWINLQGHNSDHPTKSILEGSWETMNRNRVCMGS